MAGAESSDDEFISQINVTPLVDVMLVLLIVMMVTASTIVAQALDVELPKGATGAEAGKTLVVSVSRDGNVSVDGRTLSAAQVRELARREVQEQRQPRAVIAADGRVPHRHVVELMDALRSEQLTHVAIAVQKE